MALELKIEIVPVCWTPATLDAQRQGPPREALDVGSTDNSYLEMLPTREHWSMVALGHLTAFDTVQRVGCKLRCIVATGLADDFGFEIHNTYLALWA